MARPIHEVVEELEGLSTGLYRYRMQIGGLEFNSEPVPKERFLLEFDEIANNFPELTAVQYETKSGRWQTF